MELIKRIKQAEAQAQQTIEQARADAAGYAEEARQGRRQALIQAEQDRKKAIEAAVAQAEMQGLAEAEVIKSEAEKQRQQLREGTAGKMGSAVAKVMDYLKG